MKTHTQIKPTQGFNKKTLLGVLLAAGMAMGSAGVSAATDTATFGVSATVESACVVGNGGTMAFGTLALLDATNGTVATTGNDDANTTFPVACTNGATSVQLKFTGTDATGFKLASAGTPADKITYTLFANADYSTSPITRDTLLNATSFAAFAADGTNKTLTIYGRIDLASTVTAPVHADYADTVTITISY